MKGAFTLIEVLVVVAIIALLISILLPSLSRARGVARNAKCLADMRDMATGVNTFANTHKGCFQLVTGGVSNADRCGPVGPDADGHGGFARKLMGEKYGTGQCLPGFGYLPKTRVSPYQVGNFPVP